MRKLSCLFALSLAALLGGQLPAQAQQDQIIATRGAPVRGTVVRMTPSAVFLNVAGSEREFAANEIRKLSYGDDPPELNRARDHVLQGRLEDARSELAKLNVAELKRDVVRQDVEYFKAYCNARLALTGGGDKGAAAKGLLDFVGNNRGSYHFFEAAELLGDLALSMGNYPAAIKYYGSLSKAPWRDYQLRSAVLEAQALVAQQDFKQALQRYENVINFQLDTPEATRQKLMAQVGKAVCLAETGNHQEGIKLLEDIIAKNDPQDTVLYGRAYNALGACYRQANQPKDALLAYLKVSLLFYGEPEIHAEALHYLSKLWTDVNQPDRAVRDRNLLQSRYAGSRWTRQ